MGARARVGGTGGGLVGARGGGTLGARAGARAEAEAGARAEAGTEEETRAGKEVGAGTGVVRVVGGTDRTPTEGGEGGGGLVLKKLFSLLISTPGTPPLLPPLTPPPVPPPTPPPIPPLIPPFTPPFTAVFVTEVVCARSLAKSRKASRMPVAAGWLAVGMGREGGTTERDVGRLLALVVALVLPLILVLVLELGVPMPPPIVDDGKPRYDPGRCICTAVSLSDFVNGAVCMMFPGGDEPSWKGRFM